MRGLLSWALVLLLGLAALSFAEESAAGGAAADPDGTDLDLDEDDLDDDDESEDASGGMGMGAGQGPPVDDFDLDMPEEERKTRMRACLAHTMSRAQAYQEQLQAAVKQMVEENRGAQMTPEQAANSIVFSWMISCYMNIEDDGIKAAVSGTPLPPEAEQDLFSHHPERGQQANQASQRQWQLLESVLLEHKASQPQRDPQRDPRVDPRAQAAAGSSMSGQTGALYILVVFGVIFGAGAIGVLRLMRSEAKDKEKEKDKPSKAEKKLEKAEKKLTRKQK